MDPLGSTATYVDSREKLLFAILLPLSRTSPGHQAIRSLLLRILTSM